MVSVAKEHPDPTHPTLVGPLRICLKNDSRTCIGLHCIEGREGLEEVQYHTIIIYSIATYHSFVSDFIRTAIKNLGCKKWTCHLYTIKLYNPKLELCHLKILK